jgi:hypothetical protein
MVVYQLEPVLRLHLVEKPAILEAVESSGARWHLACPSVL